MMAPDPKTWRELRSALREMGASPDRTRGSHERWLFDDGAGFTVVCNHLGHDVPANILAGFRRLRARRSRPPRRAARVTVTRACLVVE